MSTCYLQTTITKQKFLNFDFKDCKITKCLIKGTCIFNVLTQGSVYNININSITDILKVVYAYLINTQIDTNLSIINNSPITFLENTVFLPDINVNEVMIIREIFNVCERNNLKLEISIDTKKGILYYKDS